MDYESVNKSKMPGKVRLKAGRLGLWWEDKGLVIQILSGRISTSRLTGMIHCENSKHNCIE